jgi:hypothetical protein
MLGFDEGTSRGVRERLTTEFESLKAQGLTRPDRPSQGQEEWYARRDRMVLEAAARIEALIPPQYQKPNAVAEAMNLGHRLSKSADACRGYSRRRDAALLSGSRIGAASF